jgi:indole-3-glycerol phosphate synthase
MTLLDRILEAKREEIARMRGGDADATPRRDVLDVRARLRRSPGDPLRILAEVKFRSPSAGDMSRALDAGARAVAYAAAGAAMVSVLCDERFFGGSWDDLGRAHAALREAGHVVPLLAKEFVLDEVQIARARRAGADAVLLIVRILPGEALGTLARAARTHGLEPIFEVADEDELGRALACQARVVGVNARDLDTLAIDRARAARVLEAIPPDAVALHLSGLRSPVDVRALARTRADGALVGEALMKLDDPKPLLAQMTAAAKTGPPDPERRH